MSKQTTVPEPLEATERPTILDVAAACGVSPATVSNVLANKPYVKEQTRLLVQQKVAELGYRVSRAAQSLRTGRSGSVGLIIGDISNPYVAEIVRGVEEVLWAKRNNLILCNTEFYADRKMAYAGSLLDQHVEGLILVSQTFSEDEARLLGLADVPVVTVNRPCEVLRADQVGVDGAGGIRAAVQYLAQLGHQRIAFVKGAASSPSANDRYAAYRKAVRAHGLVSDAALVVQGDYTMESGSIAARELWTREAAPTAIVAANDLMAIGALGALKEMSIDVPRDVSVIGFDDIFLSNHPLVRLTTVHYSKRDIGLNAARLLMRRIEGERSDGPRTVTLDTSLIVRGTTAPPHALKGVKPLRALKVQKTHDADASAKTQAQSTRAASIARSSRRTSQS
ncbi:LacI family DNA-binding transcriptional regulator [Caballeronia sp. GAFFF2]|uniref:LacI family DNA-binding transcriptional regulator n=1 Tax=Caballeronia sp. GAFFF2 TaxID=2921741 RepID=UPI002028547C|nr:LacI family DNA-binding transcriptional regulator [Caballeronia sp. GAFFF2]